MHRGGVLCILLIVKLDPQSGTGSLIECEFRISKYTQKSKDFETKQEKITTYSISTECFEAVVASLWPVWLFIVARGQKQKQYSVDKIFRSAPSLLLYTLAHSKDTVT